MRLFALLTLLLGLSVAVQAEGVAPAQGPVRLTVVELFTSQGCSSCPPADALLAELATADSSLLPLGLHVTYWDRLGWKDPYSFAGATERQRAFSSRLKLETVYTPQVVVDGRLEVVGSDRAAVRRAIGAVRAAPRAGVALALSAAPGGVTVHAGAGEGRGMLLLVGFDRQHTTPVRAGENGGRTLTEVNVVRAIAPAGTWDGAALDLVAPRPLGERTALLLQAEDGRILGAVALP